MTLTVRYNSELDIVESTVSGVTSPEELREETIQIAAAGQANDCCFFLSDFSDSEPDFTTFDVFELPDLQDETGMDRCAQVAVVSPMSGIVRELADFYETVCFNRSWSARVFTDRQVAIDWLTER